MLQKGYKHRVGLPILVGTAGIFFLPVINLPSGPRKAVVELRVFKLDKTLKNIDRLKNVLPLAQQRCVYSLFSKNKHVLIDQRILKLC